MKIRFAEVNERVFALGICKVTRIAFAAFSGCSSLKNAQFPLVSRPVYKLDLPKSKMCDQKLLPL